MKTIVFNTSPLIFLTRLGWLKDFIQLGLNVKGTLAILKMMSHLTLKNRTESLYMQLLKVNFRVKRKIFDEIFHD